MQVKGSLRLLRIEEVLVRYLVAMSGDLHLFKPSSLARKGKRVQVQQRLLAKLRDQEVGISLNLTPSVKDGALSCPRAVRVLGAVPSKLERETVV